MKAGLLILFFSVVIVSCKRKNKIPGDVLPPQKMEAVLWDIMRADKFLSDYVFYTDTSKEKKAESIKLYQQVFTIHDITKEKFQHSFSWYKSHPAFLKSIMDSLNSNAASAPTKIIATDDTTIGPFKKPFLRDSSSPFRKRKIVNPI